MSTLSGQRSLWDWVKLGIGGAGLSACGLWWLLVTAILVLPDPVRDDHPTSARLLLLLISVLSTALFLVIFRSGLRRPFFPSAPVRAHRRDFLLEPKSAYALRPRRPHLRLVRSES